ncbi:MAG: CBS domain-containing protein [Legionellaceae bacterium]|nr:CBS domain-containing protein [Legionellaceae bacterium]
MSRLILSLLPKPRRPIARVQPDVSVQQCLAIMLAQDIGALLLVDDNNVVGILSERDLVRNCLNKGLDIHTTTAGDVAYADISVLQIDDTIEQAMQVMTSTKRRHVLIEEHGELAAMISIGDILYYLLDDNQRVIEQLENYIHTY